MIVSPACGKRGIQIPQTPITGWNRNWMFPHSFRSGTQTADFTPQKTCDIWTNWATIMRILRKLRITNRWSILYMRFTAIDIAFCKCHLIMDLDIKTRSNVIFRPAVPNFPLRKADYVFSCSFPSLVSQVPQSSYDLILFRNEHAYQMFAVMRLVLLS